MFHYCVSSILQGINKTWWYKCINSFFQTMFWAKYNLKPTMYIAVIWLSSYSAFFFLFTFQCFFSVCFLVFFNVFCTPPNNQKIHCCNYIPLKYDVNTRLLESSVNWGKNIGFSLCTVALYLKAFCTIP